MISWAASLLVCTLAHPGLRDCDRYTDLIGPWNSRAICISRVRQMMMSLRPKWEDEHPDSIGNAEGYCIPVTPTQET